MLPSEYISQHSDALQTAAGLYQVGTLAIQSREWGLARACLERAEHLAPWDSGISQNLKVARAELTLQLGASPLNPAETLWSATADLFSDPFAQALLGLGILFGTWSAWKSSKKWGPPFGFAAVLVLITAWAQVYERGASQGYLKERSVLRSGPAETYMELSTQEAGIQVRVLEIDPKSGAWLQVRYRPDSVGWVPRSAVLF